MVDSDYCPECNAFLRRDATFCHICGHDLGVESSERIVEFQTEDHQAIMNKDIRSWAVWLLLIGVIHIFTSGFLSAPWGVLLLIVGLASFFIRDRVMFIVYGVTITWAAISNLISTQAVWIMFAIVQVILAISLFRKFFHYGNVLKDVESSPINNPASATEPGSRVPRLFPIIGFLLGIASIGGFIACAILLMFIPFRPEMDPVILILEFGLELMVNIGVLGVAISLSALLAKYGSNLLNAGGIISGGLTMLIYLGLIFIL
jgi:hypothetical protein